MLTAGSLYSGVGAGDLGVERAGGRLRWQVERDAWRRAILANQFPTARRYVDVTALPDDLEPVDLLYADPPSADPQWMPPIWAVVDRLRPAALLFNSGGRCATDLSTHLEAYGYSGIGLAVTVTARRPDTDLTRYRTMALALRDAAAEVLIPLLDQEGSQSIEDESTEQARSIPEMVEHVLGLPRGWTCLCRPFTPDACEEQTDRLVALSQCCPPSVARWSASALVERLSAVMA